MSDVLLAKAANSAAFDISRIALGVEYKGSNYRGFQRQPQGIPSVQACLEQALSQVAGGAPVELTCAGRTDAMVHACVQVVHFDTPIQRSEKAWVMGANSYLPADISILWAKPMPAHFDARFSAYARRYRYVIYSDLIRPAHLHQEVTWTYKTLDIEKMQAAANYLLGTHDFSSFRAAECQAKKPVKTVHHARVLSFGQFIVLDIRADAFLHHMVRNIVGVLMRIGAGEKPIEWMAQVIAAQDRKQADVTAPPYGLYMIKADYPDEFAMPQRYLGPHFLSALPDVEQE